MLPSRVRKATVALLRPRSLLPKSHRSPDPQSPRGRRTCVRLWPLLYARLWLEQRAGHLAPATETFKQPRLQPRGRHRGAAERGVCGALLPTTLPSVYGALTICPTHTLAASIMAPSAMDRADSFSM